MKTFLLAIVMLVGLSSYAQSATKNDCYTCVGATNSTDFQETNNIPFIQNDALVIKTKELEFVNSQITNTILELRKQNVVKEFPEYVNTGDDLLDKKNYLTELTKLLPEKENNINK